MKKKGFKELIKGQAMTEFAVILPIFLLIFLGTMELGRCFFQWHTQYRAAEEGVKAGAMSLRPNIQATAVQVANTALAATPGLAGRANVVVVIPPDPGLSDATEPIQVTVRASVNSPIIGFIPGLRNLTLTATAEAFLTSLGPAVSTTVPQPPPPPPPPSPATPPVTPPVTPPATPPATPPVTPPPPPPPMVLE